MPGKVKIIAVDDHPIFLDGLQRLLETDEQLELVGIACDGKTAFSLISERKPDIAILDISMPELNGLGLARRISVDCPSVRSLLLTVYEDRLKVREALRCGASGYILKRSAAKLLLTAIHCVLRGETFLDPEISNLLPPAKHPVENHPALTAREAEVLRMVAWGYSNKAIAAQLDISPKSVETYRLRATEKAGLSTRVDIVRYATLLGWMAIEQGH